VHPADIRVVELDVTRWDTPDLDDIGIVRLVADAEGPADPERKHRSTARSMWRRGWLRRWGEARAKLVEARDQALILRFELGDATAQSGCFCRLALCLVEALAQSFAIVAEDHP
jgi:hypothetical protein